MSFFKKRPFAVCAAVGEGCALILTALLLLPAAWAVSSEMLPERLCLPAAIAAAGLAVLLPSAVIARIRGREAVPLAGAIGGGYILLAAVACALGGEKSAFGPWLLYLAGAAVAGALLGAVLSVRQNRHKKHRR